MKNLHETLLKNILSFKPIIKEVGEDDFFKWYDECSINYKTKEIEIQVCKDEINWIKEGKLKFASRCYVDVESIVKGFELKGNWVDAYGSIIVGNELLLNNYDATFFEDENNPKGFVNIIGFTTIDKFGKVRFSQIVYSFRFNKLLVRDDVTYMLPFKPNLETDFGGKRGTYRNGSLLSLRTTMEVYDKVDKKFHQSDSRKDDLSYPRLELR